MLVCFFMQGYAFFSISFSTLSVFVSYFFAAYYWKDLNRMNGKKVSHWWFKAALVFSVMSSFGAFALAYMMANKIMVQTLYLASIYFFLHFQYNGWFFFAGMGLLVSKFEIIPATVKPLQISLPAFLLCLFACLSFISIVASLSTYHLFCHHRGSYCAISRMVADDKSFYQKQGIY